MPKFFYYSHQILLDIAVGAFCTVAIVAFAFWLWRADNDAKKRALLCIFYLASAGAFLSKGVVGIFHVVAVVGVFCLVARRWQTLRKLLLAWPILFFIVPVAVWVYLFYREGGIGYLHEHFVNNVIGRFLKVQFISPGAHFYHTDLGKTASWHFYINNLTAVVGAAIIILLPAIWDAAKHTAVSLRQGGQNSDAKTAMWLLLLIWAIAPVFLLSFPAAKETSYIIPSYAAIAILVGAWLDGRLPKTQDGGWSGIGWLFIAAAIAVLNIFSLWIGVKTYLIIVCGLGALTIIAAFFLLCKKKVTQLCFLFIMVTICVPTIYNAPSVQLEFLKTPCALPLAKEVWLRTGDAPLYLYMPRDMIRGSIPFYVNRTVREIDLPEQLHAVLTSGQKAFVLTDVKRLGTVQPEKGASPFFTIQELPDYGLNARYIILTNAKE